MGQKFTNNARATLAAGVLAADTSLTIDAAKAALFPEANTGVAAVSRATNWFKVTLQNALGTVEIVYVRTRTSGSAILGDLLRGQEGTTAANWNAGDVCGLRATALDLQLPNEADYAITAGAVTNGVYTVGDQTIGGVKTFSSDPVISAGTANGVPYLNGSKVLTSGSALQFDGANLGLGVTPSAWSGIAAGQKVFQTQSFAISSDVNTSYHTNNAVFSADWLYLASKPALKVEYDSSLGAIRWFTAPSGTAGAAITFTQAMTLNASGNLLVGVTSGSWHQVVGSTSASGNPTLAVGGDGAANATAFYPVSANGYSSANAAAAPMRIGASTPGRSINASGTINASGADYAEYENNNGLTITKGSIVGFKADGTLTDTYADAIRFAIKSTNPSYVGGDTWGSEDQVGKRPDEPVRIADKAETTGEGENAVTTVIEAGDTDAEWAAKQTAYATAKAAFEAALEAARQQVDRIAYSGKVPCNVLGATPGGYIIAVDNAGAIAGAFVADPDFAQYKRAVGRVNRILPDGRCEVAVIIH